MLDIDLGNVTLKLEDYLVGYVVGWKNFSMIAYGVSDLRLKNRMIIPYENVNAVFGFMGLFKCYAIESSFDMTLVGPVLKNDIFPNGTRPSNIWLAVTFSYPNQFLASISTFRHNWPDRSPNASKSYMMQFLIHQTDVLKRRNKSNKPCNTDWQNHDQFLMERAMETVGCRPSYLKSRGSALPRCSTKEQMRAISNLLMASRDKYSPPCQTIADIRYEYVEHDVTNQSMGFMSGGNDIIDITTEDPNNHGTFGVLLNTIEDKYKEIRQVRAFGIQSLIGNAGGYVGLFLGKLIWRKWAYLL